MSHDEPEVGLYGIETMYEENYRKIKSSEIFLSLYNSNMGNEAIPAMQLGIAILLGKPLYVLAKKGDTIPEKLKQIADHIEYYAGDADLNDAVTRMFKEHVKT